MNSKKMIILLAAIIALAVAGCDGEELAINDTYTITVCHKTEDTVTSAEGIEYDTGQSAINRNILKRGEVFEVFTTHFVIGERRDRYTINRVIKQVNATPEPCP